MKKVLCVDIAKAGRVQELTLSKKSKPGDGTHSCGFKKMSRT